VKYALTSNEFFSVVVAKRGHGSKIKLDALGRLVIPTAEGFLYVPAKKIIRCEADVNYTKIFMKKTKVLPAEILISKPLKTIETALKSKPFIRIHQHHLVNSKYIAKYIRGKGGQIQLTNGIVLNVSVRHKKDVT